MGQQISCNSFYCQSIDYKPDWFSSSHYSFSSLQTKYTIERGIIQILPSPFINLQISKNIDLENIEEFLIPLHFKILYPSPFHLSISLHSFHILFKIDLHKIQIFQNEDMIVSGKIKQNVFYKILFHFKKIDNKWKPIFQFYRNDTSFGVRKDDKQIFQKELEFISLPNENIQLSFRMDSLQESFLPNHHFSLFLE